MLLWPYCEFTLSSNCNSEEMEKNINNLCHMKAEDGKYNAKKIPQGYLLSRVSYLDRSLPRKLLLSIESSDSGVQIKAIIKYQIISLIIIFAILLLPGVFIFEMGLCFLGLWKGCSSPSLGLMFAFIFLVLFYLILLFDFNRGVHHDHKYLLELVGATCH